MKKHLLAALLVVGSMSYGIAAVPAASGTAKLPIQITGTIVSSTENTFVVEVLSNAGATKGEFLFAFGDVLDTVTNLNKEGMFKMYMTDNSGAVINLTKKPVIKLMKGTVEGAAQETITANKVKINYTLDQVTGNAGDKEATSAVKVAVDASNADNMGHFGDSTVSLTATVK